jgi:hypothetical protein
VIYFHCTDSFQNNKEHIDKQLKKNQKMASTSSSSTNNIGAPPDLVLMPPPPPREKEKEKEKEKQKEKHPEPIIAPPKLVHSENANTMYLAREKEEAKEAIRAQLQTRQVKIDSASLITQEFWLTPQEIRCQQFPNKHKMRCRYDHHTFSGRPFPWVDRYKSGPDEKFRVRRYVCSAACNVSLTIELDIPKKGEVFAMNGYMAVKVFQLSLPINRAPALEKLACYNPNGEGMEIDEWRANFDMTHNTIESIPPSLEPYPMRLDILNHDAQIVQKRHGDPNRARSKGVVISTSYKEQPFNIPLPPPSQLLLPNPPVVPMDVQQDELVELPRLPVTDDRSSSSSSSSSTGSTSNSNHTFMNLYPPLAMI